MCVTQLIRFVALPTRSSISSGSTSINLKKGSLGGTLVNTSLALALTTFLMGGEGGRNERREKEIKLVPSTKAKTKTKNNN